MKVFFVGIFHGSNGPINASKSFVSALTPDEAIISRAKSRPGRILETLFKIPFSDAVCICVGSQFNYFVVKLCRLFNKNMYYIAHGVNSMEYKINAEVFDQQVYDQCHHYERVMYENAKAVICVSVKMMELLKKREPDLADKFHCVHFGYDFVKRERKRGGDLSKHQNISISVGGGMPRKNNIPVCEAIKRLNNNEGMNLRFIIIGPPFGNAEKLRAYDFVTYYESLSHPEVMALMGTSSLYIQNSIFDTFSIAVLEAIDCECSILISSNVGAAEVLSSIEDGDIVNDPDDVDEIVDKIKKIIGCPNAQRIREGIDDEAMSNHAASRNLYTLLNELEKGRC